MEQLRLDGLPAPVETSGPQAPLSRAQREILRYIGLNGSIRPRDAGRIIHENRKFSWANKPAFYASDGSDALKRLAKRGLVRRTPAGHYVSAAEPDHEPETYDPATAPWPEGF